MINIVSYSGGVNSTAIVALILLGQLKLEGDIQVVFCDIGAETPSTYTYIRKIRKILKKRKIKFITIKSEISLYDYCMKYKIIPTRRYRWCTAKFKAEPMNRYRKQLDKETRAVIGIDAGEKHRAINKDAYYPLVEMGIDREGCKRLIKEAGLPEAQKTGCFLCPMQLVDQWKRLYQKYPKLWKKTVKLERVAVRQRVKKGKKPIYLMRDMPLNLYIQKVLSARKHKKYKGRQYKGRILKK